MKHEIVLKSKGKVTNGKLTLEDRELLIKSLEIFEGKEVLVEVRRFKEKRTGKQNNYYWGVVLPFVKVRLEEAGWRCTLSDVHSYLKSRFCKKTIINEKTQEAIDIESSTSDLSTIAFGNYIEEINGFVGEWFGESLPEPDNGGFEYKELS